MNSHNILTFKPFYQTHKPTKTCRTSQQTWRHWFFLRELQKTYIYKLQLCVYLPSSILNEGNFCRKNKILQYPPTYITRPAKKIKKIKDKKILILKHTKGTKYSKHLQCTIFWSYFREHSSHNVYTTPCPHPHDPESSQLYYQNCIQNTKDEALIDSKRSGTIWPL